MPVLPGTRKTNLEFFEQHIATWQAAPPTAIGLTAAQLTAFAAVIGKARTAFNTAEGARIASKAATTDFYGQCDPMVATGRDLIRTIKAFAESSANPDAVYALAQIPPPAQGSPGQPPDVPTNLTADISAAGELTLHWDATTSGPSTGVFFIIARKNPGQAAFTTLVGTAEKAFIAPGFTGCDGVVQYRIMAVRGSLSSDWGEVIAIDLGGGGQAAADPGLKMAA